MTDNNQYHGTTITPPVLDGHVTGPCLGRGGYASVWLAWRQGVMGFQIPVAVKVLHEDYTRDEARRRRFYAESRLLAALNHPNIIHVHDAGETDDRPYYVMEFVHGTSLGKLIDFFPRGLPVDVTLNIAIRIGSALSVAHHGIGIDGSILEIIHRDVNPSNILVGPNATVKLIDFGISIGSIVPRNTKVNVIKGNPRYLSPEQAFGLEVDARTDIYSLGLSLYEALTGIAPLAAETQEETLLLAREPHISSLVHLRPEVTREIDRVILKSLARDPGDRFQTMKAFVHALHQCLLVINPSRLDESLNSLLSKIPLTYASSPSPKTQVGPNPLITEQAEPESQSAKT